MLEIYKALGDENRLRILNILQEDELCVCEVEVMLDLSQSNASRHLTKLKIAGMISASKDAQWIHYKINDNFANDNPELMKHLNDKCFVEEIFEKDRNRYKRYKENNLNCDFIREDKENVLSIIK